MKSKKQFLWERCKLNSHCTRYYLYRITESGWARTIYFVDRDTYGDQTYPYEVYGSGMHPIGIALRLSFNRYLKAAKEDCETRTKQDLGKQQP
jgi:hypothetical protein